MKKKVNSKLDASLSTNGFITKQITEHMVNGSMRSAKDAEEKDITIGKSEKLKERYISRRG
ncbi:hypothetical protein [Bacillus cereus]|uniref:hypothetical protein n=1 Tax=Bacillus cereus TaxID=1396 RepID=UPI000305C696|nr:hypothetical protein [Bacillus cereus]